MTSFSIGDALFTKTQQRVLGLLFGQPARRFYTNDIMRRVAMGRGTVRRELDRLVAAGLLLTMRDGNQLYYQANPDSPVFAELCAMVRKTFGVAEAIRAALMPLDDRIQLAFVYGSLAQSRDTATSDIDVLLVGEALAYSDVMDLLLPLESSLMRPLHPTLYTPAEFAAKRAQGGSFLRRVMQQPKLWVKGCDDDLGGAG